MWNPSKPPHDPEPDEDDSWEVRAFAEDTAHEMGTTWPPRSYTCTFCRREFRSAQALGGHMNVHRRDRARLHQSQPSSVSSVVSNFHIASSSSIIPHPLLLPNQDNFISPDGLWFQLYRQLPNPSNGVIVPGPMWPYSIPPNGMAMNYPQSPNSVDNLSMQPPPNFPVQGHGGYLFNHSEPEASSLSETSQDIVINKKSKFSEESAMEEEIDLELRLGQSRPPL